jgi:hypothetical protein
MSGPDGVGRPMFPSALVATSTSARVISAADEVNDPVTHARHLPCCFWSYPYVLSEGAVEADQAFHSLGHSE